MSVVQIADATNALAASVAHRPATGTYPFDGTVLSQAASYILAEACRWLS